MERSICIIVRGYPTRDNPIFAFIQPLARGLADAGYRCSVIAPQSITKGLMAKTKRRPYRWIDTTEKGNSVVVYQPSYISFSAVKAAGVSISALLRNRTILRCFIKEKMQPDILYAHFWENAVVACDLGNRQGIPVFVATGESKIWVQDYFSASMIDRYLHMVKGVIAVSKKNLIESQELGLLKRQPETIVLPNAVNPGHFYPMGKKEARQRLNWPEEAVIAIFVGAFHERKGPLRVLEAAKRIPKLKLAFVGSGNQNPQSEQVIFCASVPHEELVTYLNAADFFVLPTLAEGCCNAIIEALACGLPIISSDRPFNDGILTERNSIRIEPTDIDSIFHALDQLYHDAELRDRLSQGALETATDLKIEKRVSRLVRFMEDTVGTFRE